MAPARPAATRPTTPVDYTLPAVHALLERLPELRALAENADGHDDTPAQACVRETLMCLLWDLETAIQRLPDPLRQAVYWRCERGLTEREAARELGIAQHALQYRIHRAERGLQKILSGLLVTAPKKLHCKK